MSGQHLYHKKDSAGNLAVGGDLAVDGLITAGSTITATGAVAGSTLTAATGNITAAGTGSIVATVGDIIATAGAVTGASVEASTGDIVATIGNIEATNGNFILGVGDIEVQNVSPTQITSKTTAVAASGVAGKITTVALTDAAGGEFDFDVTNTHVVPTSNVFLTWEYDGAGFPVVGVDNIVDGQFTVSVKNVHAANAFNDTLAIHYLVIN